MTAPVLSRRDWLKLSASGVLGAGLSGWFAQLASGAAPLVARKKSCILLWMSGGPTQMDTFDLKPGHKNGGPFKEIDTAVPGIRISEHLPKVAKWTDRMAILRSVTSKEGDHGRATHLMHTGYLPQGGVAYPAFGAVLAKELDRRELSLPGFVSIAPYRQFNQAAFAPGFLGPQYAPLIIADNAGTNPLGRAGTTYDVAEALKVHDLETHAKVSADHANSRLDILRDLEKDFASSRPDTPPSSHRAAYEKAVRLMRTEARKAFDLHQEKDAVRKGYGETLFGQSCLLARRLVERGVPFIEINHGGANGGAFGWDTHADNFNQVKALSATLDQGWAMLMSDLKERGLLDSTLIIWMGEFGRTPVISNGTGRDHWPNSMSVVLAGGGINGGQVVGATSKDGTTIEERKLTVGDVFATIYKVVGINPEKQNIANGRPIRLVEKGGEPIKEVVG